jgi:catechol 2,3-dioxygenase-like lactoylglutathione lyase family enzyme
MGMNSITIYLTSNVIGGFRKLATRFVGGDVKLFFDDHLAKGMGDMMISMVGLLLAFWFVHFLYRRKVFLRHDDLRARLGLTQHQHGNREPFDETRAGLDHLSFAVSSREQLDAWAQRFSEAGVTFSPVAVANSIPGAAALVFRDPDNIQLELFFDPSSAAC